MGALAPDIGPPGAFWSGAQGGALILESEVPCGLRGGTQFAMALFLIVVEAEIFEQGVGFREGGDVLGSEERREAFLPEVVGALDLAFGLRCGRVTQGDVVEAQGGADLGESLWLAGKEEGVVVDVESQREAVGEEGGGEKVEMGREVFALVNAGAGDDAAGSPVHLPPLFPSASSMVVDDLQERRLTLLAVEPAMRRSVILPEPSGAR